METYKTSQKTIKVRIAYKRRLDGTAYTFEERSRSKEENVHYEEWDANDKVAGKEVYNELIAYNEADKFIRDKYAEDNCLWAEVYFVDIPRNKEYYIRKFEHGRYTRDSEFKLRKVPPVVINQSPNTIGNTKIFMIWDKVIRIDERKVVELPVTKYKGASQQVNYEINKETVGNSIPKLQ